jgi:hypothetical protein
MKTSASPVDSCGYGTWRCIPRDGHVWRLLENRAPSKISATQREEVIAAWRYPRKEELPNRIALGD